MAPAHGYTYDVFVSCSSRDANWVRFFIEDLVVDTNKSTGPDIHPFFDEIRLQPGYVWDKALLSSAADSALLLPILSPRFLQSDYCKQEIHTFLGALGAKSHLLHRSRILPVKYLCSTPKDHPLSPSNQRRFAPKTLA
jgi:hypothetical protein